MKKIYVSLVMLVMASAAFAQRTIQLSFELVSPPENYTINVGDNFTQQFIVKNLGPDAITPADSLLFRDVQSDPNNTNLFWVLSGFTKAVNDTIIVTKGLVLNSANQNGPSNYCVYGFFQNAADSIVIDSVYSDCNQVVIAGAGGGGSWGVEFVESNDVVSKLQTVYPNPARTEATFVVRTVRYEAVSINIVDIAGRVVISEDKGNLTKGEHRISVPTADLAPGVYLYKVTMGDRTATGKLNVIK